MNNRIKRYIGSVAIALPAFGLIACAEDNPSNHHPSTVEGRLDSDGGNQHTGGAQASADAELAAAVGVRVLERGADGEFALVHEADLAADGTFVAEGIDPARVQIIEAVNAAGDVVGRVLVPEGDAMAEGEVKHAFSISAETTVEAAVWEQLDAEDAGVAAADVVAEISAQMAASASTSELASGIRAAAEARAVVLERDGFDASAVHRAQLEAQTELRASLAASTDAASEMAAWVVYHSTVAAAEAEAFGEATSTRADAAANLAMALHLDAELRDDVIAISAGAQALLGSSAMGAGDLDEETRSSLQATLDGFIATAYGTEPDFEAALDAMRDALLADTGVLLGLGLDLQSVASASTELRASIDAAAELSGRDQATAIADAIATFEASVTASASGLSEQTLSTLASLLLFLESSQAALATDARVDVSATITATFDGALDLTDGATGLLGDVGISGEAESLRLLAIDASGSVDTVAEAAADEPLTFPESDSTVHIVQALDASGEVIAAALVPSDASGGDVDLGSIDVQDTVEAMAVLAMIESGTQPDAIDLGHAMLRIDAAVAAAVYQSESMSADVALLAEALLAAQQAQAGALDLSSEALAEATAGSAAIYAEATASGSIAADLARTEHRARMRAAIDASAAAQAQATAIAGHVFASMLAAGDSQASAAAEARASLEAALAAQEAALTEMDLDLSSATASLMAAHQSAFSSADIDAAAAAYVEAVLGSPDEPATTLEGAVAIVLGIDAETGIGQDALLAATIQQTLDARATLVATVNSAAAESSGNIDAFVAAASAAHAAFASSIAVDGELAATGDAANAELAAELMVMVAGGIR